MPLDWNRPLQRRRRSLRRLAGIDVYYDFDWVEVFQHDRSAFPRGQSLAELVKRDTPNGKRPTLLLTVQEDVEERAVETDERYVVIVYIFSYLRESSGDPASTYYARTAGQSLTRLAELRQAEFSAAELDVLLDAHLEGAALRRWLDQSPERAAVVRAVVQSLPPIQISDSIVPALENLARLRLKPTSGASGWRAGWA